jgi:hypothetical protein
MSSWSNEIYQYIAGIIDAEGTITMMKNKKGIRNHHLMVCTCDDVIVPYLCKLFHKQIRNKKISGSAKNNGLKFRLVGSQLREFLPKIIPYLFIKQPQAKLVLNALNIKSGKNTIYTNNENKLWNDLYKNVILLNKRGNKFDNSRFYNNLRTEFTWPWIAGMIDGDGCIRLEKRYKLIKPSIKISLSNKAAIEFIAKNIGCTILNAGKKIGNKKKMYAVRMMTCKIAKFGPLIVKYLKLKDKEMKIVIKIVNIRLNENCNSLITRLKVSNLINKFNNLK